MRKRKASRSERSGLIKSRRKESPKTKPAKEAGRDVCSAHERPMTPAGAGLQGGRSKNVNGRINEDPHDVDEVPVDARHFDPPVLLGRVMAPEGADRREQQQGEADEDVGSVKAGEPVEDGALRVC